MAKEVELLSPIYEEMRVIPGAAVVAGEVIKYNSVLGFMLIDHTAAQVAAGESAALITKAAKCKVVKNTGETWVPGEPVYWDAANSEFSNVALTLDLDGHVIEDVASAPIIGYINFDGMAELLVT